MVTDIAASRKINADSLHQAAITLKYVSNGKLMEDHLVDGLLHLDEVQDKIRAKMGIESGKELPLTEYADYAQPETPETEESTLAQAGIAVVYAVGAIESGEGDDETIGSDRIAEALRQARLDENVKAVVLRVNSPGGSALASDVIWRETQLIKASGKPLVVSMGDYAASGGYYISCAADKIFANPNTITGSIGVFGVIPNLQNLFDHKLGITFDRYETAPHADFLSINKPFDEVEKQKMNDMIVGIYDDFLNRVSTGRNMEVARVDSMARGRVWTGMQAKEMGLVDEIGGLQDAIQAAAKLASLEPTCPQLELPKQEDPWSHLMGSLAKAKEDIMIRDLLGDRYAVYRDMRTMLSAPTVQARLPFVLEIN
jgi:protease-4